MSGPHASREAPAASHSPAVRRWPLWLIASPAAVAVWSGWVGLGTLCGFGKVHPLPGIVPGFQLNTAITLPVGVEAYGAYALGAWLHPHSPETARAFARRSALGALALGMAGQVIYHLLAAAHASRAPWPVVVLVSCLPVITLGFGAALTHLLRARNSDDDSRDEPEGQGTGASTGTRPGTNRTLHGLDKWAPAAPIAPAPASAPVPESAFTSVPARRTRPADRTRPRAPGSPGAYLDAAEVHFAADLAAGRVPSVRAIKAGLHVGQARAQEISRHLATVIGAQPVADPRADATTAMVGSDRQPAPAGRTS